MEPTVRVRSKVPFGSEVEVSVNGVQTTSSISSESNDEIVVGVNVNGAEQDAVSSDKDQIIPVDQKPVIIELFYWEKISGVFWQVLSMPNLEIMGQGDLSTPVLWQVLTPRTEHVFTSSESLTNQNEWKWSKFWFSRSDSRDQSEMESWIGASEQPSLELPLNQSSISAIDSSQPRWVYLVPLYVVWFPIGCATILFSGLLFHVHWMRSPWVLLGYVILFVGLASWWLDIMILFVQVVIMTGVFSVASMLIAWMLDRSTRRRTVLAGRGTTIGSLPQRSNGKSDSKVDSKQDVNANQIDNLPTTISPNIDIVRSTNVDLDRNGRSVDPMSGGSSVRGTVR
jgi:hypothetical protein